jgi:hypothetical protein
MIAEFKDVYAGAWRYALACPLLFAVPVIAEFIQHVIEMRIGMYDGIAALKAAETNGARLGWGLVKTLSLTLAGYWVARFLLMPGGAAAARRFDPVAARLYLWVMLWALAQTLVSLWGGDALRAAGLGAYATGTAIALGLAMFALNIMLAPWMVSAALGNPGLGIVRSLRLVGWGLWWGVLFTIAAILLPMAAHYAFAVLAIGAAPASAWAIMAVDSLLVGYLGAIIAATNVAIARRFAENSGAVLVPRSAAS